MSNIKRYIEEGAIYFVTSVTHKRKPIFKEERFANLLLATIEYFKYYLEYVVYGYVVMFDHFHILIQPSEKYNISKVMNYIKGNFVRRYNEIIGRAPLRVPYPGEYSQNFNYPVWQKRFYDEIIRNEEDFYNKIEYMHNNPVKSQIVENPKDYRFSSYHQYNGVIRNTVQVAIVVP